VEVSTDVALHTVSPYLYSILRNGNLHVYIVWFFGCDFSLSVSLI